MTEEGATMAHLLDFGEISVKDSMAYLAVVQRAVDVHQDRERIRKGLWKQYPALDQFKQAKIKIERICHALEIAERDGTMLPLIDLLEESPDVINYTIFGHRILQGEFDV